MKVGKSITEISDTLIVLLNCSATFSIIPYIIFHQYQRGIFVILIAFINFTYLCFKYGKRTEIPDNKLFNIYCILLIWNAFASLYSNTGFLGSIAYLLMNASFFILMYNLYLNYRLKYSQKETLWLIVRGYCWLIILCILSVLLLFIIIKIGINPYTNNISSRFDLFEDNVSFPGNEYYAPYHLGVLLSMQDILRIPFFSEKGIICGIYHEPHTLTFMVFPSLFIMWAFVKKNYVKTIIFIVGVFIMLIAASTTNIIMSMICLIVALFFSKKGKVWLIPLLGILFTFLVIIGLENTDLFFIINKLEDGGGSKSYTLEALKFAFIPKTIVGSNILSTSFIQEVGNSSRDAGFVTVILNLIFLIGIYIKMCRLLISSRFNCLIGIGVLYFMLHSMKTNMTTYTASILLLCVFLVSYTLETSKIKQLVFKYGETKKNIIK